MINLLPKQDKFTLVAGEANRLLLRYSIMMVALAALAAGVIAFGYFSLQQTKNEAKDTINSNQQAANKLSEEQKNIKDFKNNLAVSKKLLDERVNYSLTLVRIGASLPQGVAIDSLQLSPEIYGKEMSFKINGDDEEAILNAKTELAKSPYFKEVQLREITFNDVQNKQDASSSRTSAPASRQGEASDTSSNTPSYPVTGTIVAELSAEIKE